MSFKERVERLLTRPAIYQENLVNRIDEDRLVRAVTSPAEVFDGTAKTIKIEGLERIFPEVYIVTEDIKSSQEHYGPVNAHLFWAEAGSPSFDVHTDPNDVILVVEDGVKVMEVDGVRHELRRGDEPFTISANVPHRALNEFDSIMISYGLMDYIEDRWE